MSGEMAKWLAAYHDGELSGAQLERMEAHLEHCSACQAELARLESLSALLAVYPAAEGLSPSARFEAAVQAQLPPRPEPTRWGKVLRAAWRLAPAALLGALVFLQTTHLVGWLVSAGLRLAPQSALAELFALPGQVIPQSAPAAELEAIGRALLCGLTGLCAPGLGGYPGLLAMGLAGVLYLSWLASWAARRRHHQKLESITAHSRG